MARPIALRGAVCECISWPHDDFLPQLVTARFRHNGELVTRRFSIKWEVMREGGSVERVIFDKRFHLDFDAHPSSRAGEYRSYLQFYDIVPVASAGNIGYASFVEDESGQAVMVRVYHIWSGSPPAVGDVGKEIGRALQRLNRSHPLGVYLRRMTPKGWCPPSHVPEAECASAEKGEDCASSDLSVPGRDYTCGAL